MLPRDPAFERKVRENFSRQRFMSTLGASLTRVEPGEVEILLPFSDALTQQKGSLHAGALASIADSACGYAALTLMAPGADVVSVEFKINLMAPAVGTEFRARAKVMRAGRTLTVCSCEVHARQESEEVTVAVMQATMMSIATPE